MNLEFFTHRMEPEKAVSFVTKHAELFRRAQMAQPMPEKREAGGPRSDPTFRALGCGAVLGGQAAALAEALGGPSADGLEGFDAAGVLHSSLG